VPQGFPMLSGRHFRIVPNAIEFVTPDLFEANRGKNVFFSVFCSDFKTSETGQAG
jgi:hypothetical protein